MELELGQVNIITGKGPGKTTSAFGLGFRAASQGLKVYIIQFLKSGWHGIQYGEVKVANKIRNFKVAQFGSGRFCCVDDKKPTKRDLELAHQGLKLAKEVVLSGKYDIVILDEVCVALYFSLITTLEVIDLIKNKPYHVRLILTGRYAPKELYTYADYISEINEIKHPYPKGEKARLGIEY